MAVEDAAVLGNLLSRLSHPAELTPLLRGYEVLRHHRTSETQKQSRLNQHIFHLPDGPAQQERDDSMRRAMETELARVNSQLHYRPWTTEEMTTALWDSVAEKQRTTADFTGEGNSNQWADMRKNREQFGYDADLASEKWWVENGERVCRLAVANSMSTVSAKM